MSRQEDFENKQSEMSDEELIKICEKQITDLCRTGGRSFTMCVPPRVDDSDMVLSELIKRFKSLNQKIEKVRPMLAEAKILIKQL